MHDTMGDETSKIEARAPSTTLQPKATAAEPLCYVRKKIVHVPKRSMFQNA